MIPATQRKLDQARANFRHLHVSARAIPLDRGECDRLLGEFLSAAYSVVDVMKYEIGKPWVDRWWSKRSDDEQALRSFMREQRRIEVHYQGAAVNTEQQEIPYWDYLLRTDWKRSGGTNGRSFFSGPVGTEMPCTPVTMPI